MQNKYRVNKKKKKKNSNKQHPRGLYVPAVVHSGRLRPWLGLRYRLGSGIREPVGTVYIPNLRLRLRLRLGARARGSTFGSEEVDREQDYLHPIAS